MAPDWKWDYILTQNRVDSKDVQSHRSSLVIKNSAGNHLYKEGLRTSFLDNKIGFFFHLLMSKQSSGRFVTKSSTLWFLTNHLSAFQCADMSLNRHTIDTQFTYIIYIIYKKTNQSIDSRVCSKNWLKMYKNKVWVCGGLYTVGACRKCKRQYCHTGKPRFRFSSFLERAEAVIRHGTKCCFSHWGGEVPGSPVLVWGRAESQLSRAGSHRGRVLSQGRSGEAAELWPADAWLSPTMWPWFPGKQRMMSPSSLSPFPYPHTGPSSQGLSHWIYYGISESGEASVGSDPCS